ncbi:MAG TPA: hypothetical protein VGO45_07450 [Bacteroidia bacterium]|jgi:hypothetical protein|nr:hypothetical protein [Bacteroidia bacterium]
MAQLNKYIACFLICVFSFAIVPKEFIHVLYGHEDTTDHNVPPSAKTPLVVSSQHIHCELLNFETDVFYLDAAPAFSSPQSILYTYATLPLRDAGSGSPVYISLRGPPLS